METMANKIAIEKAKSSKIHDVDFDNLSFGSVYSDHMLVCDYKTENGIHQKWFLTSPLRWILQQRFSIMDSLFLKE